MLSKNVYRTITYACSMSLWYRNSIIIFVVKYQGDILYEIRNSGNFPIKQLFWLFVEFILPKKKPHKDLYVLCYNDRPILICQTPWMCRTVCACACWISKSIFIAVVISILWVWSGISRATDMQRFIWVSHLSAVTSLW